MPRTLDLAIALAATAALAGCTRGGADAHHGAAPAAHGSDPPAAASSVTPTTGAMTALADGRTPLPLTAMMAAHQKQEMRDHLRVIQEVTAALAKDDFAAVAASAARIGWTEQQAAMCKHMGAGAPGFADLGERFHHPPDGIASAARAHDRAGVLAALGATLDTCVTCHQTYRQEIVDADAFAKLGGSGGCPMMGGMAEPKPEPKR
jgi:cytochrome c556